MSRSKVIHVPIFETDIHLLVGNASDWIKWNERYDLELETADFKSYAMTILDSSEWIVYCLFKSDKLDYNTICHEFVHIMDYICDMHDIKCDVDNNEARAYIAGFVGREIFKFREKLMK